MNLLDSKTIKDIKYYVPSNDSCGKLADFFQLFSDLTRLRILSALSISSMCVSDICSTLNLNQTTVSHQLKLLRDMQAVTFNRQGKVLFYKLSNAKIKDVLLFGVEYLGY